MDDGMNYLTLSSDVRRLSAEHAVSYAVLDHLPPDAKLKVMDDICDSLRARLTAKVLEHEIVTRVEEGDDYQEDWKVAQVWLTLPASLKDCALRYLLDHVCCSRGWFALRHWLRRWPVRTRTYTAKQIAVAQAHAHVDVVADVEKRVCPHLRTTHRDKEFHHVAWLHGLTDESPLPFDRGPENLQGRENYCG